MSVPPPPPPPPLRVNKKVEVGDVGDSEVLKLIGGKNLKPGDVFYHVRKFVVTRTETTYINDVPDDSTTVTARCVKRHWQLNQPS